MSLLMVNNVAELLPVTMGVTNSSFQTASYSNLLKGRDITYCHLTSVDLLNRYISCLAKMGFLFIIVKDLLQTIWKQLCTDLPEPTWIKGFVTSFWSLYRLPCKHQEWLKNCKSWITHVMAVLTQNWPKELYIEEKQTLALVEFTQQKLLHCSFDWWP